MKYSKKYSLICLLTAMIATQMHEMRAEIFTTAFKDELAQKCIVQTALSAISIATVYAMDQLLYDGTYLKGMKSYFNMLINADKITKDLDSDSDDELALLIKNKKRSYDNLTIFYPGDPELLMFNDIAGLSEAKEEMSDIILYLSHPEKFKEIGATYPKGILMEGGPGCGKTLMARAVAGEAGCPFIVASGASFDGKFVGDGADRIKNLFIIARALSAQYGVCLVFIDEIDSLLGARDGDGHPSSRQTVNSFLAEMDGFTPAGSPVIFLGATNRKSSMDEAAVRPGRFDRSVTVHKPQIKDRVELLTIKLKNLLHQDINIDKIAAATQGFSGAELVELINEAAILAVHENSQYVRMNHIEQAFDHVTLGREIKGMHQTDAQKWVTSVHEAGHIVGYLYNQNDTMALHKVSITPRSKTLGIARALPLYESYSLTESDMKASIVTAVAGGLSEQAFNLGKSTGLSSDLRYARQIAYDMVVKYGMSEKLNYLSYDAVDKNLPNDIATEIHREAKKIVDECIVKAKSLIQSRKIEIEKIAKLLMKKGTVLGSEIYTLLNLPEPKIVSLA